jgi:hypothetical protein
VSDAKAIRRLVGTRPHWGFDFDQFFYPFSDRSSAELAAATWTADYIRGMRRGLLSADCVAALE